MNVAIKYRKVILIFLLITGLLFGVFIYSKLNEANVKYILDNIQKCNYINNKSTLFHILLLSTSLLFSITFIGIVFLIIYLIYECVVIGFISSFFVSLYGFNGLCYSIIYVIIYKLINLFLFVVLIIKYIKIVKNIVKSIKKQPINITKLIVNSIIISFSIIINDIFLYFFGAKILNIFSFLLK